MEDYIREMVGGLVVAGFAGTAVNDHAKRLIVDHRIKNIILFQRNVESMEQTKNLTNELQNLAKEAGHPSPLIICTDQENGVIRRIAPDLPGLPGSMAVAATGDAHNAYRVGRMTALQLLAAGINMTLAPVLDVNNNPRNPVIGVRSFGENPNQVADFGEAMVRGLQSVGVIACAKHFPGHGDTVMDSHNDLPTIRHSIERLESVEWKPFVRAIDTGVDAIMTAHIVFSALEYGPIPATLSKRVLTDLLRVKFGYTGVVITDCLEMNAISRTVGVEEGAVQALAAGADLLLVSHRLDRQVAVIKGITRAVLEGRLKEEWLQGALARVQGLRARRRMAPIALDGPGFQDSQTLNNAAEALQRELCAGAATIVQNDAGLIPVDANNVSAVDVLVEDATGGLVGANGRSRAATDGALVKECVARVFCEITKRSVDVRIHTVGKGQSGPAPEALAKSHLILAVLSGLDADHADYLNCIQQCADQGLPVVAFAIRSPYDLSAVSSVKTRVAVYENTPWMTQAGIQAIFGVGGTGSVPVTL